VRETTTKPTNMKNTLPHHFDFMKALTIAVCPSRP
jgi:hypothetical protein